MKLIVAVQEPHLRGSVAPNFEGAPYYVAVDTHAGRTTLFLHPAQFQVAFTPAGLVRRLRHFAPDAVVAGSFTTEAQEAAAQLQVEVLVAHGCAAEALDRCARTGLSGRRA